MNRCLLTVLFAAAAIIFAFTPRSQAQTTEFTYQGNLQTSSVPANGTFDFEFRLFSALSGGTQVGSTLARNGVIVSNGVFSVNLDFGSNFPGASRFIEIHVRPTGGGAYTPLAPRQQVNSVPYSVQALNATTATNATQLGGIVANQYVTTTTGAANFIQNTTSPQPSSNFNISGNGAATIFNAVSQYNLTGNRILSQSGTGSNISLFVGTGSGTSNTGGSNTFVGAEAGQSNTTGEFNSFFGTRSGFANSTAPGNTFIGSAAGVSNTTGYYNVFVGNFAGNNNQTGSLNAYFGRFAGGGVFGSLGGSSNSMFGNRAGANSSGDNNSFFGHGSGVNNQGNSNSLFGARTGEGLADANDTTLIGYLSTVGSANLSFATAIGSNSIVSTSNTIALGRVDGSDKVVVYGLGTAGATALCRNASNQISTCSSSIRYKQNVNQFLSGLALIKNLHPVSFNWKDGGMADMGLVAEDVAAIEPLLTTINNQGEVEGVKYDRIGVVLINAVKEQQVQLASQQKAIDGQRSVIAKQQAEIEALKALLCRSNKKAAICRMAR